MITGATSGIGLAIAEAFAREGVQVVITGRNAQRGRAVIEAIHAAGGLATFLAVDLTLRDEIDRLVRETHNVVGRVDILVNNAILPGPTRTPGTAAMGESLDQLASSLPAGRPASPAEIAEAAVYLASDEVNFVHGATLPVDGGRMAIEQADAGARPGG